MKPEAPDDTKDDDALALAYRALGHPARLHILRILGDRSQECCCNDIACCLPLAQSTVSQHIKVLLDAGLVERQARGTRNCYAVNRAQLSRMQALSGKVLAGLTAPGTGVADPVGSTVERG